MSVEPAWRIAVDTGGTFTDCLALDPEGGRHRAKILSSGALRRVVAARPSSRTVILRGEKVVDGFFEGWKLVRGEGSTGIVASLGNRLELSRSVQAVAGEQVVLQSAEDAAVVAVRWVTGTPAGRSLPPVALRLATTLGTNALLERKGAKVALFVTRGFGDLLEIGNQQRPDLFALDINKPAPLHASVVEVDERLDASGAVLRELDEAALTAEARRLIDAGFSSAAIAFVHSFRNQIHEQRALRILSKAGFRHVACSSVLSRRIKIVPRAQTALVDAYLAELLGEYLNRVRVQLATRTVHVMTSAGGLVGADKYRAKDSLLSGPAAGVVGAVAGARRSGYGRIIAFDMGGTSTDVSRFDGELELATETVVGEARLLSPSVAVETVAAGGGSICRRSFGRIRVGPESSGAHPGPACYGAGGPLTLTDVNLLLGRLVPSRFPFFVDTAAAAQKAREVGVDAGHYASSVDPDAGAVALPAEVGIETDAFLDGFLAIANEKMAGAIRAISIRRGYDPSEYTLVAFGGAGPQHAAAIADLLGIPRVLIPADGALLSAVGLNAARPERLVERQVNEPLPEIPETTETSVRLDALFAAMGAEARDELESEGVAPGGVETGQRTIFLRYQGQESTLAVDWREGGSVQGLVDEFEKAYIARYGYLPDDRTPEVESLRLAMRSVLEPSEAPSLGQSDPSEARLAPEPEVSTAQRFWNGSTWEEVPVLERDRLEMGEAVPGPCLIAEANTVTVVENRWQAHLDPAGGLVLERSALQAGGEPE